MPPSMDAGIVRSIDARLDDVERDEHVRIVWAIESGSRAWGFPSPDSDYDARFVYLRPAAEYLTPWPRRDVLEWPPDAIFDVNGWDLAKALRLLVKGNATVTEWLRSPIVYRGDAGFRDRMLALAEEVVDPALLGRHYLHVGRRQWAAADEAHLKRVFYALRPAAILNWLAANPGANVPPMTLDEALAGSDASDEVRAETRALVAEKAVTSELGRGAVPPAIAAFVEQEFARAVARFGDVEPRPRAEALAACEAFFRDVVAAHG